MILCKILCKYCCFCVKFWQNFCTFQNISCEFSFRYRVYAHISDGITNIKNEKLTSYQTQSPLGTGLLQPQYFPCRTKLHQMKRFYNCMNRFYKVNYMKRIFVLGLKWKSSAIIIISTLLSDLTIEQFLMQPYPGCIMYSIKI